MVELMVAMAIGLVVVGAVLTNYLNNTAAARKTNALTQISSDATIAMGILRNHIATAGFALPANVNPSGQMILTSIGQGITGCDRAAMTRNVTMSNGVASPPSWGCGAAAPATNTTASDSILVRYQTDADTSPLTQDDHNPMNCVGDNVYPNADGQTHVAENNFHIDQDVHGLPALYCQGGSQSPIHTTASDQPLVENIVEMHLTFGVAAGSGKAQPIVRYVKASDVGALPDTAGRWDAVKSVRICLVVRSADAVLTSSDSASYIDCDKSVRTRADRYIYRAFTTTVVLNNRLVTL
jgi:type IV pilus assembly protein PilW